MAPAKSGNELCPKETLPGGAVVYTESRCPITTDSLLLAAFCPAHRRLSVCDLGAGSGILLLSLVDRGLRGEAVGVEMRAEAVRLLQKAAAENGMDNVKAVHDDLRRWTGGRQFDCVVSNPPYFAEGALPQNSARARARHGLCCTPQELCGAARRLLKEGGRLCVCWPARRLCAMLGAMRGAGLEPKRLQFARKSHAHRPWLALIEARRAGGEGLTVLPDIQQFDK